MHSPSVGQPRSSYSPRMHHVEGEIHDVEDSTYGFGKPRFSRSPKMHHVEGETHELDLIDAALEKDSQELATDCLGEISCSVEYVESLLHELKSEENPSEEVIKIISELEEVHAQSRKAWDTIEDLMQDEAAQKSYGDLVSDCLEDGCSVESIDVLLDELRAQKDPSPELTKTIAELEKLRVKSDRRESIVRKLYQAQELRNEMDEKSDEEIAVECLKGGCSSSSIRDVLSRLKADEKKTAQLAQTIKKLEEHCLAVEERENMVMKVAQGAQDDIESSEALIAACLKDGCSVDSLESLLHELSNEKNPSPQLTQSIHELSELHAQTLERETLVARVLQAW